MDTTNRSAERGIALITTMLVMMLISALLIGFTTVVVSDQKYRFIDRDRGQAFYAAAGGLEKLTSDLGTTFMQYVAPTNQQITNLTASTAKPVLTGVTFTSSSAPAPLPASELVYLCATGGKSVRTVGSNGYTITFCGNSSGNPTTEDGSTTIKTGPYEGLMALKAPYQLDVTAKTDAGGEVHLVRTIEAVAIPVFQFGMFSDVDLAFNAADDFSFGGRVHTNGNLFLAQAANSLLTLSDKVTAVKEIVRKQLSNGVAITVSGHTGTVNMAKAPGVYRAMLDSEGSVTDGPTSSQNEPTWHTVSQSTYNGYIKNSRTGAKALNLPLVTVGGSNPDLIRRPKVNEQNDNPTLMNERLFTKASIRILLSDKATDITNLPTVTTTAPVLLDGDWGTAPPAGYNALSLTNPPIALLPGALSTTVAGGSTASTIRVASTASFRPPMTLDGHTVTCAAKTNATTFSGCNNPTAAANNKPLTGGPGISVQTSAATIAGTNVTISVPSTATFYPIPFFIGNTLVTCTGWDATPQFTGCAGLSAAPATNAVVSSAATGDGYYTAATPVSNIGGYLKVERQDTNGNWADVTMEFLNYGIGANNLAGTSCGGDATVAPNAILRIQRFRDNQPVNGANGTGCNYNTATTGALNPANWWPQVLYDSREAVLRDSNYPGATTLTFNGVMYYISLDVANLIKYFRATAAPFNVGTGGVAKTDNGGYTVYFSDRRNNRNLSDLETAEYGWEDIVNPTAANGQPNGVLDSGEDVNANSTLDVYGGFPSYNGVHSSVTPNAAAPFATNSTPATTLTPAMARVNRPIFFRRALKLINGATIAGASGITGLTIVAENPVYVHGDWNVTCGNFNGTHAATAIVADAVTVLSNNWNDITAIDDPYNPGTPTRPADTWYRMGIIQGKNAIFPHPNGTGNTFGTDGGAHAFIRYLEGSPGNDTIHYRGSLATFFFSRQATGIFKGSQAVVYQVPSNRDFAFDIDFLNPSLLPPNTPVFRDMNAVGFSQELRPGR